MGSTEKVELGEEQGKETGPEHHPVGKALVVTVAELEFLGSLLSRGNSPGSEVTAQSQSCCP